MHLVQFPQSGIVLDLDLISTVGEVQPGRYLVALSHSNHGPVLPLGDYNLLLEILKDKGLATPQHAEPRKDEAAAA